MRDFGFRISDWGLGISDFGLRIADFGFRISDFGLRISDWGISDWELVDGGNCDDPVGRPWCQISRALATVGSVAV